MNEENNETALNEKALGCERVSGIASNWSPMSPMSAVEISPEDMRIAAELSRLATPRQLNVARRLINGVIETRGDCGRKKLTKPEIFRVLTEMYINKLKREISRVEVEGDEIQNARAVLNKQEDVDPRVALRYHQQVANYIDEAFFENLDLGSDPEQITARMIVDVLNTRIDNLRMKHKKLENDLERAQENSL